MLDISAAHERRATLLDTVRRAAAELFIPFTVGGGIRTLEDAAAVFAAGADKISINSAALADPTVITRIAARFGSQAVVVGDRCQAVCGKFALGSVHAMAGAREPLAMQLRGHGRRSRAAREKFF